MFQSVPVLSLVAQSGPFALSILLILSILSVYAWAVILLKIVENKRKGSSTRKWFKELGAVASFADVRKIGKSLSGAPLTRIANSALKEMEGLSPYVSFDSLEARTSLVQEALDRSVDREKHGNDKRLSFLAMVSSVAPFLGLLGTVWGIMEAFHAIGNQGSANITVVAPGIAEALITTIVGLSVAIPASAAYNYLVSFNRKAETMMYDFASELLSLFKRGDLKALEKARPAAR